MIFNVNGDKSGDSNLNNVYGSELYSATTTYNSGDCCIYNNAMYEAIQDNVTGVLPTNTDYWKQITLTQMLTDFQAGVNTIFNSVVSRGLTPSAKTPSEIATTVNKLTNKYFMSCAVRSNETSFKTVTPLTPDYNGFTLSGNVFTYTGSNSATYTLNIRTFNGMQASGASYARCYCRVYVNGVVVLSVNGDGSANTTASGSALGSISRGSQIYIQHHGINNGYTNAHITLTAVATS